jgi:hypothetical protein
VRSYTIFEAGNVIFFGDEKRTDALFVIENFLYFLGKIIDAKQFLDQRPATLFHYLFGLFADAVAGSR